MERAELVAQPVGVTEIPFLQEHIEIQVQGPAQEFLLFLILNVLKCVDNSVSDPYHFDLDPDPRIRIRVHGSGSGS